jgi:RNA polymerase sigma-70 factor (ECF subfamily)
MHLRTTEIEALIAELPPGYRTIFNLYAIEGYKHDEIATLLNISAGTSKSQLSRARTLIQQKLKLIEL